jgi:hypothetical protein
MFQFTFERNRTAVVGMIAVGMAIGLSSFSIVRAERAKPNTSVSYSCNTGNACVEGSSTGSGTWGVYGVGTKDDGVRGVTMTSSGGVGLAGVAGFATGSSTSADGVYGISTNGDGVYGSSTNAYGVYGTSSNLNGDGVYGYSGPGVGVAAESNSADYYALFAGGDSASTGLFEAYNDATGRRCTIDPNANLSCDGSISGGAAVRVRHHASSGRHVLTYASESATATIEDVGTARISGGAADVRIDPDFASVMDGKWYYVFLTPLGETRGLYVSMQTPTAFQVRETEHGHSSLAFNYRIVARPLDAKNDRLPLAPEMPRPRVMHPAH